MKNRKIKVFYNLYPLLFSFWVNISNQKLKIGKVKNRNNKKYNHKIV